MRANSSNNHNLIKNTLQSGSPAVFPSVSSKDGARGYLPHSWSGASLLLVGVIVGCVLFFRNSPPDVPEGPYNFHAAAIASNPASVDYCARIEQTVATIVNPGRAEIKLTGLVVGLEEHEISSCEAKVTWCTDVYRYSNSRVVRLVQKKNSVGKLEKVILEGFACPSTWFWGAYLPTSEGSGLWQSWYTSQTMHDFLSMPLGTRRKLKFTASKSVGVNPLKTYVEVVSDQGGFELLRDDVLFNEDHLAVVNYDLYPGIDELLLQNERKYSFKPGCEPRVQSATSSVLENGARVVIAVSVAKGCPSPDVTVLSLSSNTEHAFSVSEVERIGVGSDVAIDQKRDSDGSRKMSAYKMLFNSTKTPRVSTKIPVRVGKMLAIVTIDSHVLWKRPPPLFVSASGNVHVFKSKLCALVYCYHTVDTQSLDAINNCMRSGNPFASGEGKAITFTVSRKTVEDRAGWSIADNAGRVSKREVLKHRQSLPESDQDKIPDREFDELDLDGVCSGNCTPGQCRRQAKECNPGIVKCPDVEWIMVKAASLYDDALVDSEEHPLHNDFIRIARLQNKTHRCQQPYVIVVTVSPHSTLVDPPLAIEALQKGDVIPHRYQEGQSQICKKATTVLKTYEGAQCLVMPYIEALHLEPGTDSLTYDEKNRCLQFVHQLEKCSEAAYDRKSNLAG